MGYDIPIDPPVAAGVSAKVNGRIIPKRMSTGYLSGTSYARDVARNLPETFTVPHGDSGTLSELTRAMQDFVTAGRRLDALKKRYFYGKGAEGMSTVVPASTFNVQEGLDRAGISGDLFHGILGNATESSELIEALLGPLTSRGADLLDPVNIKEEIGDGLWYLQTAATSIGCTLEECALANAAKLAARYPDRFTEDAAINRDLTAERKILEGSATSSSRDTETADHATETAIQDGREEVFTSGSALDS